MAKLLLPFLFFLRLGMVEIEAIRGTYKSHGTKVKLFVFGDSYVDTGNSPKSFSMAWKHPYGVTYPGKPVGRFSDGRVLTDFIAQYLGIRSPVPYKQRKSENIKLNRYGMNFAFGGAGVFDTLVRQPNLTTQIDYFEQVLAQKVYTKNDLEFSIALVSIAGNDYSTYLENKGSIQGISEFMIKLINKLVSDVKRIHDLGVRRIGVVSVEAMGCLPPFTGPSFQNCNDSLNLVAQSHKLLLEQAVNKLKMENGVNQGSEIEIVVLDFYTAFMSALDQTGNSLRPCCVGMGNQDSCGSQYKGENKYTICNHPNLSFFWDMVHPSQHGWAAIYSLLQSSLHKLH